MIGVFPTLRPDELLYSGFARYQAMMDFPSTRAVRRTLFGLESITAVVDLPGHLGRFVSRLPPGNRFTLDRLLRDHTLLPYYQPFVPRERVAAAVSGMCGDESRGIHRLLNVTGSAVKQSQYLRFCQDCFDADREVFGHGYWRRVHQLPSVLVCPTHRAALFDSQVLRRARVDRYGYHTLSDSVAGSGRMLSVEPAWIDDLGGIAEDSAMLLTSNVTCRSVETYQKHYRALARRAGWLDQFETFHATAFEAEFVERFGSAFLRSIGVTLSGSGTGDTWISRMLQRARASHAPVRHLLLNRSLGGSLDDLLAAIDGREARGAVTPDLLPEPTVAFHAPSDLAGPCRNVLCKAHDADAVKALHPVAGATRRQSVRCPSCAFHYWYDTNCPRVWGVLDVGRVWKEQLRRLVRRSSRSQGAIAKALGVNTALMMKLAWQLGITRPSWRQWSERGARPSNRTPKRITPERRDGYREEIQILRRQHPELGVTELRLRAPTAHAWLTRNDAQWLKDVLPDRRPPGGHTSSIDWRARDETCSRVVPDIVRSLRASPGRPRRITVNGIGKSPLLPCPIHVNLHRLPTTTETLERHVETSNQFRLRVLQWAADEFIREQTLPATAYVLAKRAGFSTRKAAEGLVDLDGFFAALCDHAGLGTTMPSVEKFVK